MRGAGAGSIRGGGLWGLGGELKGRHAFVLPCLELHRGDGFVVHAQIIQRAAG